MTMNDEAQRAAMEAAAKLAQTGTVTDLMNYDPADIKNAVAPRPANLGKVSER